MERVCEPELMNDPQQVLAYATADFEASHQMIADAFWAWAGESRAGQTLLDLGCGPGDVTMRLMDGATGLQVNALDGSPRMLAQFAERLEARVDQAAEGTLIEGRLSDAQLPLVHYDFIVSTSLLHHLHKPEVLWRTISEQASAGTRVFVVDLVRPASLDEVTRLVELYASGAPEVLRADFRASMCAAFRLSEVSEQLQAAGLADSLAIAMLGDRHWVVCGHL